MSDWAVGDLARAVVAPDGWRYWDGSVAKGPSNGWVGRVAGIRIDCGFTFLVFPEWDQNGCHADDFRKIRPDEHAACEEEFATLLKRAKRRVAA